MEPPLILVSNDDGITADGLAAVKEALEPLGEVWAVAPDGERSASSHCLTLHKEVAVRQVGPRDYAVKGWPADCVYIAMFGILPRRPTLVISGINRGPNLGSDILYSGTVGAAREAYLRGVPAISVSLVVQFLRKSAGPLRIGRDDYLVAATFTRHLAAAMLSSEQPPMLLNVNVPLGEPRGAKVAMLGRRNYPEYAEPKRTEGDLTYYRIGSGGGLHDALVPDSDGEAVEGGYISITPLGIYCVDDDHMKPAEGLSADAWRELEGASSARNNNEIDEGEGDQ